MSLAQLRRLPPTDETVQSEWRGILTEVRFQREIMHNQYPNTGPAMLELKGWMDLFRPRYLRRTAVAIAIPFFQQVFLLFSCSEVKFANANNHC